MPCDCVLLSSHFPSNAPFPWLLLRSIKNFLQVGGDIGTHGMVKGAEFSGELITRNSTCKFEKGRAGLSDEGLVFAGAAAENGEGAGRFVRGRSVTIRSGI